MDYKDLSNLSNNNDTELLSIILGTKPEIIKEAVAEVNRRLKVMYPFKTYYNEFDLCKLIKKI